VKENAARKNLGDELVEIKSMHDPLIHLNLLDLDVKKE